MNLDKVLYFMNQFIEEQYELEQKYAVMFGHGVPREMFPPCISKADIMKAVKYCIQNKKEELSVINHARLLSLQQRI